MSNNPSNMTAVELQQLDREELHRLARQSAGLTVRSRLILGRCLLAIQRSQSYYERGACSVYHFALLELQIPQREAYQSILVARRLEVLPALTQAALTGRVSWSALEIIISRATPDNESTWLEMALLTTPNCWHAHDARRYRPWGSINLAPRLNNAQDQSANYQAVVTGCRQCKHPVTKGLSTRLRWLR